MAHVGRPPSGPAITGWERASSRGIRITTRTEEILKGVNQLLLAVCRRCLAAVEGSRVLLGHRVVPSPVGSDSVAMAAEAIR